MGRRTGWLLTVIAAVTAALPPRAAAQEQNRSLTGALQAYQNLEYESAAALFRRALAVEAPSPDTLPTALRPKALTYLAASDFYRGRKDSAAVVFRRLIQQDPRYRPDPLIFPPEVTQAFESARRGTKVVAVFPPPTRPCGWGAISTPSACTPARFTKWWWVSSARTGASSAASTRGPSETRWW